LSVDRFLLVRRRDENDRPADYFIWDDAYEELVIEAGMETRTAHVLARKLNRANLANLFIWEEPTSVIQ
jgi:hypothetical protein